jgi:hypothetical protein
MIPSHFEFELFSENRQVRVTQKGTEKCITVLCRLHTWDPLVQFFWISILLRNLCQESIDVFFDLNKTLINSCAITDDCFHGNFQVVQGNSARFHVSPRQFFAKQLPGQPSSKTMYVLLVYLLHVLKTELLYFESPHYSTNGDSSNLELCHLRGCW